jgi:serine protease Do
MRSGAAAGRPGPVHDLAALTVELRAVTVGVNGPGSGRGAGVVWRGDGLIVTSAHVLGPAAINRDATRLTTRSLSVTLSDGRVLPAVLVGRDPSHDLAALRVEARDLTAARIGDSDRIRPGQLVLAVGNPFGLDRALTLGVVHAVDAAGRSPDRRWIQADVRLAPGNSGGPLATAGGLVIGVSSMISAGVALAIPSRVVEGFLYRVRPRARPAGAPP